MTGTAETEAAEFDKIYKLDVLVIPTNRPLIRVENPDVVYRTEQEKFDAVVEEIRELHESGRPVLVGTISIEKSEQLAGLLKRAGIRHVVLNAKYHEREAEIVAQAGPVRGGHHRHQHGGPRHRHHPRRRGRPPGPGRPGGRRRSSPKPRAPSRSPRPPPRS